MSESESKLPKVRLGKLSEFREQSKNANQHNERGIQMLDDSMSEDGYVAPMTAVADGEMIDGSARLDRAYERFGEDVIVVEHDGTKPIITVRSDIPNADAEIAKRISLRANRVASVNLEWNIEVLASMKSEGIATEKLWTEKEWNLLVPETPGSADADVSLDRASELQEKWQVQSSEIIQIGRCRACNGERAVAEEHGRPFMPKLAERLEFAQRADATLAKGETFSQTDVRPSKGQTGARLTFNMAETPTGRDLRMKVRDLG